MQQRALAFLTRSIRQDSRLISHHVMRAAMPVVILYLFAVQLQTYSVKAGAGASFAGQVMNCCYWFLTLVGGIHFSTAIVEEKEEQTLPLLKMTGVSPFAILIGKSLPRLAVAILFLSVIAPFLILSITLGGVLPIGLLTSILSILCYAVMLSQIGLFASVVARTSRGAFTITCIIWLIIELSHWWYGLAGFYVQAWTQNGMLQKGGSVSWFFYEVLGRVPECSLIANLSETLLAFSVLDVGVDATWWEWLQATTDKLLRFRMGFQLVVAAMFFLLSLLLFERCTSRETAAVRSKEPAMGGFRRSSRVWANANAWKSWQMLSGGLPWFLIRAVIAPVVIFVLVMGLIAGFGSGLEGYMVFGFSFLVGFVFFLLNLARLFGRVLNSEIHDKTLASLVMLPQTTTRTVWQTITGTLPAVAAGGVCAVLGLLGFIVAALAENTSPEDIVEFFMQPWFWHTVAMVILTVHLGLLLTTYMRYGGMILAAVLVWFVAPMFCSVTFMMVAFAGPGGAGMEDLVVYLIPIMLIVFEALLCVAMQRAIIRRLETLAAQ